MPAKHIMPCHTPATGPGRRAGFGLLGLVVCVALAAAPGPASAQLFGENEMVKAGRSGSLAGAQSALMSGESANTRSSEGSPVLVLAAEGGHQGVMDYLLTNGAHIDGTDAQGRTALMWVASGGHEQAVRMLLARGAAVNRMDRQGETALVKAVRRGQVGVARLLLDAGADPEIADYTGNSAIDHARNGRSRELDRMLEAAANGG